MPNAAFGKAPVATESGSFFCTRECKELEAVVRWLSETLPLPASALLCLAAGARRGTVPPGDADSGGSKRLLSELEMVQELRGRIGLPVH